DYFGSRFLRAAFLALRRGTPTGCRKDHQGLGRCPRGGQATGSLARAAMRLRDKVAVVTGAASGIGRATATLFAHEGARLVLNDIDAAGLARVTSQIGAANCRSVVGDVSREQTSIALAAETVASFGQIDILVNNAGIHFLKDI